jgi:hypothetical protein
MAFSVGRLKVVAVVVTALRERDDVFNVPPLAGRYLSAA